MFESVAPGDHFPLGARYDGRGVNFCVYAFRATQVELLLFEGDDSPPAHAVRLDPEHHRTGHYWHVYLEGLRPGQRYAYRVGGPRSLRFDPHKALLDPYGVAVAVPASYDREAGVRAGDNAAVAMKSVVADLGHYDWEGDHPLERPFAETIIYELHVGGFTKHPSSGVAPPRAGTYLGLIDKIPYLVELGVTAVELLPVFQFDEQHGMKGLPNYWGYSPVSFFAPHVGYATDRDALTALDEFRDMVKALHRAGIEVILDVVYNHTAESGVEGPTQSFRGFADEVYYAQRADGTYLDYTGTGNTIHANHAVARRMILDSLTFWAREMHVDGFRFDLASILTRGRDGEPLEEPPILWAIDSEPALAGCKLIAEAWDAAGLYQVGRFGGDRFTEWNGRFRDDVRCFLRGDEGFAERFAARLTGSPDIYAHKAREPSASINFVTCHDGFTLEDLVSYSRKYNAANREESRDGANENHSWNCGAEGPTDDPAVQALRLRQIKNFHTVNLLALGTPMMLMGDELRRTQRGNNNAWCQDNEVSWLNWSLLEQHTELHRFVRLLVRVRQMSDWARLGPHDTLPVVIGRSRFVWHGVRPRQPDWRACSHSLAVSTESFDGAYSTYVAVNAWREPLRFVLPAPGHGRSWRRWIDTGLPSPRDIVPANQAPELREDTYELQPHSVVLLVSADDLPPPNGAG